MTEYELVRSRRKTLSVQVTRECRVIVRAPLRLAKREIDRFVFEHADWIARTLAHQRTLAEAHPEPDEATWQRWRAEAREYIPPRAAYYARLMGVSPTAIRFSRAKTRFGSCSAKDSITFSLRLMDYPKEAVDYVIVHELAHIRHKNHGPDFYALVRGTLPDYDARIKLLK